MTLPSQPIGIQANGRATTPWRACCRQLYSDRAIEITFGQKLRAITVARIALGVLPISFIVLWLAGGDWRAILAFTLVMGAAQGVITIVRGAVPLALFGKEGYGPCWAGSPRRLW